MAKFNRITQVQPSVFRKQFHAKNFAVVESGLKAAANSPLVLDRHNFKPVHPPPPTRSCWIHPWTEMYEKSFSWAAPRLWNTLPNYDFIKQSWTIYEFRTKLKTHLFGTSFTDQLWTVYIFIVKIIETFVYNALLKITTLLLILFSVVDAKYGFLQIELNESVS